MLSLLLVAAVMAVVSSQLHLGDPCNLTPLQDPNDERKLSLEIPDNCKEGTIDWDFPRGVLKIHLALPGKSYSLCLVKTPLTLLGELQVVKGGVAVTIPLPTEGKDACTEAINGETEFLASSATNQYYWSSFDYKVE